MTTLKSEIILCKNIRLDKSYVNVLSYTENQMLSLCRSNEHLVARDDDYSFIRTTGNIFTNFTYSQALNANYIAFQNKDYSNKWFFAFIDEVIYRGEENTEIRYTIDAWSTWYDKWSAKKCFIERQHELVDTIGSNLIDENLNIGDVTEIAEEEFTGLGDEFYFAILSSFNASDETRYVGVNMYNGNLFGKRIYLFKTDTVGILSLSYFIDHANQKSATGDIEALFVVPKVLCQNTTTLTDTFTPTGASSTRSYDYKRLDRSEANLDLAFPITKVTSYSDYTPKNKKCFIYPYNYLLVSNNVGNINIYKYEDFSQNQFLFNIMGAISVGCSIRAVPRDYKGVDYNYDECLPLAKYPTGSWTSDAFTNWLTQNGVNITTNLLASAVGGAVAVATANPIGMVGATMSLAGTVANTIGQFYQASLLPAISGGQNNGDVNFAEKKNTFVFKKMRCKLQYLKVIDDYFTRFGYAIKRLDTPHLTGRRNWNYVEIGSTESIGYGDVPSKYMEQINNACRRGVTIWHTHDNIGDFSLDNSIV